MVFEGRYVVCDTYLAAPNTSDSVLPHVLHKSGYHPCIQIVFFFL